MHIMGEISMITSFGQFQGLTRSIPTSLRSCDDGKGLQMRVMHANCDVFMCNY
jgi:hypothetical protein